MVLHHHELKASGKLTSTVINSACGCSQGETIKHPDGTVLTTSRDGRMISSTIQTLTRFVVGASALRKTTAELG